MQTHLIHLALLESPNRGRAARFFLFYTTRNSVGSKCVRGMSENATSFKVCASALSNWSFTGSAGHTLMVSKFM